MIDTVKKTIDAYQMLSEKASVVVAVSGGADSIALLLTLKQLGYDTYAFHVNHMLRGAESDGDERFVRELCEKIGVSFVCERVDVKKYAREQGQSIETAARILRYMLLEKFADGRKIATAHTADDNLETMIFHLARGSGLKGLCGIPFVRDTIIRPFLQVSRKQVEAYLAENNQAYRTDSSNADLQYSRNRIRNSIIPELKKIDENLVKTSVRVSALLKQDEEYLNIQAKNLFEAAKQDDKWNINSILQAHKAISSRALGMILRQNDVPMQNITEKHINIIFELLKSENPSGKIDIPGEFMIQREYEWFYIKHTEKAKEIERKSVKLPFSMRLADNATIVSMKKTEKRKDFNNSFNTFYVDCGTISLETLHIRSRNAGDRIRLTKNGGSRTLKKLMIDRKIPQNIRDCLAVIADENGVIAVQSIGIDISRTAKSGMMLEIKFEGL